MARIARRNGSLSFGQASMTFRKSAQTAQIGVLIGASEVAVPRETGVFGRFETCPKGTADSTETGRKHAGSLISH
jgi:hypothetical protein